MEDQTVEFKAWPKIARLKDNMITITEKMDGTNACIIIQDGELVGVQSRSRLIKPGDDNFGFAAWVHENKDELVKLGDGYHYGEWVGPGIQKNPHNLEQKEFYLFNTFRPVETLPEGVKQVRVLYQGPFSQEEVERTMSKLVVHAYENNYTAEGIIVYYHDTRHHAKVTFAHSEGKWKDKK